MRAQRRWRKPRSRIRGSLTASLPPSRRAARRRCVDLVTAAQAAHWFDLPAFYAEARRVGGRGRSWRSSPTASLQLERAARRAGATFLQHVVGPVSGRPIAGMSRRVIAACPSRSTRSPCRRSRSRCRGAATSSRLCGHVVCRAAAEKAHGRAPVETFDGDLAAWGDPERAPHRALPAVGAGRSDHLSLPSKRAAPLACDRLPSRSRRGLGEGPAHSSRDAPTPSPAPSGRRRRGRNR